MRSKDFSREERIELLGRQALEKSTDIAFAQSIGISVWTLRSWKRQLKSTVGFKGFVEVSPPKAGISIRIHLPGQIVIELPFSGSYQSLAVLVRELLS